VIRRHRLDSLFDAVPAALGDAQQRWKQLAVGSRPAFEASSGPVTPLRPEGYFGTMLDAIWIDANLATMAGRMPYGAIEDGAIGIGGRRIAWVGPQAALPDHPERIAHAVYSAKGGWITPGLIDCHTHLVYAGQRAAEFARRTAGSSYSDIAREGGGILNTVRATRTASVGELVRQSAPRLRSLLQEGVTTVEIKSGYGLEFASERAMLLAARELESAHEVEVATTLLAAHAVPPEFAGRADEYIDLLCDEWMPRLAAEKAPGGRPLVESVDAYCEDIAFSAAQCDRLFAKAGTLGLPVRLHAEQLANVGGSRVAARHRALSVEHLEFTNESDVAALAAAGTVAVLLPVAYYALAEKQLPPIDAFRAHGVPIAVASDANPGSAPGASLLVAMSMARRLFGLTGAEVLAGVTCNAARALGRHETHGAIAAGKAADFVAWSIATLDELGYWIGFNPCRRVMRRGACVLERAP
jgi:imidazolonepropionase